MREISFLMSEMEIVEFLRNLWNIFQVLQNFIDCFVLKHKKFKFIWNLINQNIESKSFPLDQVSWTKPQPKA